MPTQRFLQLPQEKQRRIFDATVAELSRVPLDEASINKIVQAAGIPRGSFYQYFSDKEDLLGYILAGYRDTMEHKVLQSLKGHKGDVFEVSRLALTETIRFGTQGDNYSFCRNIFTQFKLSDQADSVLLHFNARELLLRLLPHLDLTHFKTQDEADVLDILDIVLLLLRRAIVRVFSHIEDSEQILQDYDKELGWLKYGILQEESR